VVVMLCDCCSVVVMLCDCCSVVVMLCDCCSVVVMLCDCCSVVVILCGGNIDTAVLGRCLEYGLAADGRMVKFSVRLPDRPGSLSGLSHLLQLQSAR
jgi:threonine dehydratase